MKKYSWLAAIILAFAMIAQVVAAPLFPDVPANHWARDAVAQLAAKGLVEGYPDGTFKGDRAATRWEMAMVVARMLAKSEQMWATFATKEDLEALKQLVSTLREELDALGVRVTNLEENLNSLSKRVWDLEKIRFYGSVDSIFVTQGFKYVGGVDPYGAGIAAVGAANNAVGAATGTLLWPGDNATLDYINGTPLTNGSAFTTKGILGANIRVSDDVAAGIELAAYSRMGDNVVAPYYGVTPPYLSNVFTSDIANTGMGVLGNRGTPWTKMTLDNAWFVYKPTGTKVVVGSFGNTSMDPITLVGEPNPNFMSGPRALPFFGVKVNGATQFLAPMKYEVLGSKLVSGQPGQIAGAIYNPTLFGFNLDWEFKGGDFKINFLRAVDDFFGGTALGAGGGENPYGWRNPVGYTSGLVPQIGQRPVQAADGATGLIGPQSETLYGASIRYEFPNSIKFEASYGTSTYKPNIASAFTCKDGKAGAASLSGSLFKNLLDLKAEYVGVSPYFDPFIAAYPNVIGGLVAAPGVGNLSAWPEPIYDFGMYTRFPGFYQLHDSQQYPNNRQGIRAFANYKLPAGNGNIYARYQDLVQIAPSRNTGGSDGLFMPGFVEPFWNGPMLGTETSLAHMQNMQLGINYKFPNTKLKVAGSYDHYRWKRPSNVLPGNNGNMMYGVAKLGLLYNFNDKVLGKLGYNYAINKGANGVYFINMNYQQSIPYFGLDYHISDNTDFTFLYQLYNSTDKRSITDNAMAAPWSWDGSRLFTEIKISF